MELHTEPLPPIAAQPAPIPQQSAAVKAQPEAVPKVETPQPETAKPQAISLDLNKPHEEMSVEELQEAILQCMRKNGEVTDYMLRTVRENTHHGSLLNWVRSFR